MNDPACYSCSRTVNCADCAARRARIDELAATPPRTAEEIQQAVAGLDHSRN